MNETVVERDIWINAPRERVWQAITDPKQVQQWFSPAIPWELSALEVGGRMYVHNAESGTEMYTQVIEVADPPRQFVTRSLSESGEPSTTTTYILEEENNGTRLVLRFSIHAPAPADVGIGDVEQTAQGFAMVLENIKAVVEGTQLPYPEGF